MTLDYKSDAKAIKEIRTTEMVGLSEKVKLKFNHCYLRIYKSENEQGYFYCTLAIPNVKDRDGYVLELNFSDALQTEEHDFDEYLAPCCGMNFYEIAENPIFSFKEVIENKRHTLLLNLKIKATPYYGCAFLSENELYELTA